MARARNRFFTVNLKNILGISYKLVIAFVYGLQISVFFPLLLVNSHKKLQCDLKHAFSNPISLLPQSQIPLQKIMIDIDFQQNKGRFIAHPFLGSESSAFERTLKTYASN